MRLLQTLVLAIGLTASAWSQTNLLTVNTGFETNPNSPLGGVGTFSGITGWQVIGNASGPFTIVGVSTDQPAVTGREGSAVAYIWNGSFETVAANRAPVTAGWRYLLRVRSESDLGGPANFTLGVRWYDSTSGYTPLSSSTQTVAVQNLSAFQTLSTLVTAPAGATYASVYVATSDNVGVLLDQVELFTQPIPPPNTPPSLPTQGSFSSPYGVPITVTNTVIYQGLPRVDLAYSLVSPPAGATIDAAGVLTWTPTLAQSGNTYTLTTLVMDTTNNSLTDQKSFQVTVTTPPNIAPVLPEAVRHTAVLGSTLHVANAATDANFPAQTLTYELIDPPAGASIDANGNISFTPTNTGRPVITTRVTDNGSPPLSSTNRFVVEVSDVPPVGSTNQLTLNPGFESAGSYFFNNGSVSFPGWTGQNYRFSNNFVTDGSVGAGSTTEGTRAYRINFGGYLSTAVASRPVAIPGMLYDLRVDARTLAVNFPQDLFGVQVFLQFYDSGGNVLKEYWGPEWRPVSQAFGTSSWETLIVRGVAPAGAARVGVVLNSPQGFYDSNAVPPTPAAREDNRTVEFDNVRLYLVPETADRLAIRRLPRLVEPGTSASLRISTAATAASNLVTRLVDSNGTVRTQSTIAVPTGRGLQSYQVAIPGNLPDGSYTWELGLVPIGGDWSQAVGVIRQVGVIVDQTVATPNLNATDFSADHAHVLYMGRIENLVNGSRRWHWFGSEVRLRFTGTSLTLLGATSDNGYGGTQDTGVLQVVVDEDYANPIAITQTYNNSNFILPLVSGLADGVHTVTLFKQEAANLRIRFDAFRVDPGHGLLRPEPLSSRRIEIYGDSVTNGAEASPFYFGYAPLTARELDADVHIIAQGGAGVGASFGSLSTLYSSSLTGGFWNNLSYPQGNNEETGLPWDFNTWTPDVVLVAIGHNDQFNGGGPIFRDRYGSFAEALRTVYPDVPVVSVNTTISNPIPHFLNAISPQLASDPLWSMAFQLHPSDNFLFDHPDRQGHNAMTFGDTYRLSFVDLIEERANWGLDRTQNSYEQWVTDNFSPSQISLGEGDPEADPFAQGISNFFRYALGIPAQGAVAASNRPTGSVDSQIRLSLTFFRARLDVDYQIESSTNLVNWNVIATNPGNVGELVTVTDPTAGAPKLFLRLNLSLKP
jgi:lysophospholipase L1-like esterase